MQFLSGFAPAGHALLKVYEKDRATDYQLQDYATQQKQGVAIQERMNSRIFTWGVGKLDCLSKERISKLDHAMHKLRKNCEGNRTEAPKFHFRNLRAILRSSPAEGGLGLDMWVLRLLGTLPDEALSILLDIIHLAFRGKIPMQLLLVLIGLIPKTDRGERPIAMTAMLYRVCMRLSKSSCDGWDREAAGH